MHTAIATLAWIAGLIAFALTAAPAIRARTRRAYNQAADTLGRYTRLACPHCPLIFRYRGVGPAEDRRFRQYMDDHTASH
jgi:hypothetical protein